MEGCRDISPRSPEVFDLRADPQERYDIFMNNFTESTWMGPLRRYAVLSREIQSLHQEACLIGACSEATTVRDSAAAAVRSGNDLEQVAVGILEIKPRARAGSLGVERRLPARNDLL